MSKILLVEDNEMNQDILVRLLRKRGYTVVLANDGESGVAMATAESPDIILMDISLPKMDGYEATRQIRSNHNLDTVPIIALTAHALTTHRDQALQAGCNDYETKPIDFPKLLAKVESHLHVP